jgi:hypothetical protein
MYGRGYQSAVQRKRRSAKTNAAAPHPATTATCH